MPSPTAEQALEKLKQGNERFRTGCAVNLVNVSPPTAELIEQQQPFAAILSCSDSRVPVEIIFDTGLGDLFVIRVAGNVATRVSIASIEYAVTYLGTKLIVVMAHQNCGAVTAAIQGGDTSQSLSHLLGHIQPAVDPSEGSVEIVARRSARLSAERLTCESTIIRQAIENAGVKIVTAFFHFASGEVEFF